MSESRRAASRTRMIVPAPYVALVARCADEQQRTSLGSVPSHVTDAEPEGGSEGRATIHSPPQAGMDRGAR